MTPSTPTAHPVWLSTKNTSRSDVLIPLCCGAQSNVCAVRTKVVKSRENVRSDLMFIDLVKV